MTENSRSRLPSQQRPAERWAVGTGAERLPAVGPVRGRPRVQRGFVAPGALVALCSWITVSAGLRWYLERFASLSRIYGSIGAVIALLLWLYFSSAALLLGAEVNSELQNRGLQGWVGFGRDPARPSA